MLGSLILYLKAMRIVMFQLSGFYCSNIPPLGSALIPDPREDLESRTANLVPHVPKGYFRGALLKGSTPKPYKQNKPFNPF